MTTPVLYDPKDVAELKDWGAIPTMIEGRSMTSGVLLHKGPNGENESGIWVCTPGYWRCEVTRDEFCWRTCRTLPCTIAAWCGSTSRTRRSPAGNRRRWSTTGSARRNGCGNWRGIVERTRTLDCRSTPSIVKS